MNPETVTNQDVKENPPNEQQQENSGGETGRELPPPDQSQIIPEEQSNTERTAGKDLDEVKDEPKGIEVQFEIADKAILEGEQGGNENEVINASGNEESDENLCILAMIDKMVASQFLQNRNDTLLTADILTQMKEFIENPERFILFLKHSEQRDLVYSFGIENLYTKGNVDFNFCFFIKKRIDVPITLYTLDEIVVYDNVYGNINRYLLDKMNDFFVEYIFQLNWPEGIKKNLISNMHKFLMSLSQTYYTDQKKIVLYIPKEKLTDIDEVLKDKDQISRLEAIMSEWTSQIKDFSSQENTSNREDFDVIEEIEYLELRNTNLTHISEQLENPEPKLIIAILDKARNNSENLKAFVNLKKEIIEESQKAQENHKYLKILKDLCEQIQKEKSEIKDIPQILTKIMEKIRVITEYCDNYNTPEKVAELIKKVSFQLIHKFTSKIQENNKNIVKEYNEKLHNDIKSIKNCIEEWKKVYKNIKERIRMYEKEENVIRRWNFDQKDYQSIFYDLETFEKRCNNLEEICLCQLQFGKNKDKLAKPVWGGTKRIEISKQLNDIEEKFDYLMKNLFHDGGDVLNTKVNKWQEDYRIFSKHIEDLEDMYKNTISSAFKRVNTLEEAVNYVENFYSLAKLPKIKYFIKNDIALEVISLYTKEIEQMRAKNENKSFCRMYRQTLEGGNALWSKFLSIRMEDYNKCVVKMNLIFNPRKTKEELPYMKSVKKMEDLKGQIKQLDASIKYYLQGEHQGIKDEIEHISKINDQILDDKLKHPLICNYDSATATSGANPQKFFFPQYQCNYPVDLLRLNGIANCYSRFEEYSVAPELIRKVNELEESKRGLRELVINAVREFNLLVESIKITTEQVIFQEEFSRLITDNISRIQNRYWNALSGNDGPIIRFRKKIEDVLNKVNQFKQNSQKILEIFDQIAKKSYFQLEKNSDIYDKIGFVEEQKNARLQTDIFVQQKAKEILELLMKSYKFIENVEDPEVFRGFKSYIEDVSERGFNDAIERALENSISTMRKAMLGDTNNNYLSAFFRVDIFLAGAEKKFKKDNYECNPTDLELKQIIWECVNEMIKCANNSPEIYKMFIAENENFMKKAEKKKLDEKISRASINSLNAINAIANTSDKVESIAVNNPSIDSPSHKKISAGGKKISGTLDKKASGHLASPQTGPLGKSKPGEKFLQSKPEEKEKIRFPKAEEPKRKFLSDLKVQKIEEKFNEVLKKWRGNKKLVISASFLQKEENESRINSGFQGFLNEGNSDSLISILNEYIKAITTLKTEDLSNVDSSEIPPTIMTSLFIQFDATQVKNELIKLCDDIINYDLEYITKKTRDELITKVDNEFREHEMRFAREPETQDEFKILWDELDRCEKEKEFRFKKITGANEVVNRIIIVNQFKGPNDDICKEVEDLEKRKEKYTQLLEDARLRLINARNRLSSDVDKQEFIFRGDVDEMARKFAGEIPDKLEGKLNEEIQKTSDALRILEFYRKKCQLLEQEQVSVKKGLTLFFDVLGKAPTENKILIDVKDQIKELKKIWTIKHQMNEIVSDWCQTQFYDFDLNQMEKDRLKIENELKTQCKDMAKKPLYLYIKDQLEVYGGIIAVLKLLRDEAMTFNSASHWEKVQIKLGQSSLDPHHPEFNFEAVIDLKLDQYRDPIQVIVEYAREQQKVDKKIEGIRADWRKNELKFEFKEKENIFRLLPANKTWVDDLESHLAQIAEIKSLPFYEDFKEKIDQLENDLNKISYVFGLLKNALDKWNYLKNIFSKDRKVDDDMNQQVPEEISIYNKNTEKFMEIFKFFARVVIVRECFLQKNLENDLKDISNKFSGIERSMQNLLDTKRLNFKRLYFLSNDDLFELMGNSTDQKVINYHLSKLFSGIERVDIEEKKKKEGDVKFVQVVYDSLHEGETFKFEEEIHVTSMVETWLNDLEKMMIDSLEKRISNMFIEQKKSNKNFEFVLNKNEDLDVALERHKLNGQLLLTMSQHSWRRKIEQELFECGKNDKKNVEWDFHHKILKDTLDKIVTYLEDKKDLSRKNRLILFNYILLTKYQMELTAYLKSENVRYMDNYEWMKLLKVNIVNKKETSQSTQIKSRTKGIDDRYVVVIEQLNNKAYYGYEYIGNKERLVITALTERCFLTMMTAMFYFRGGSLTGPAGTGKTETIKDLSRNLAKYLIVFNCSNKNSYNTMATLFLGLLNTGAWCCFDEFNRIEIEVLSVIRIQLNLIYDALRSHIEVIPFKGIAGVRINPNLAIFVTMNPQYMYRSELPDNLKTLFRPVAVKMAERQKICEIKFLADGYSGVSSSTLAKLLIVTIDVLEQQLSRQPHYDFSLRVIIGILMHASLLKKNQLTVSNDETMILRMAIYDMLRPKLISEDEEIFDSILSSVFNDGAQTDGYNPKDKTEQLALEREENLRKDIKLQIEYNKLTGSSYLVSQVVQLAAYMKLKHGIMLVGESMSGKTTTLKLLQALFKSQIHRASAANLSAVAKSSEYTDVEIRTIFPKSIELDELYGKQEKENIYIEGLLPYHLKDICSAKYQEDEKSSRSVKWLVLDGPVDTLWIESLNTLLDDTKMLSLPSGFRINLKADIKIVFEAENLTNATPATVSRVGLIYFEADKLSWFPIARTWLEKRRNTEWYDAIAKWFDKYVYGILQELKQHPMNYLINYHESQIIQSLIKIFDSFIWELDSIKPEASKAGEEATGDQTKYWDLCERVFVFSVIWALGGCLDEQGRIVIDTLIRKYSPNFPPNSLIFDYYVNPEKDEWGTWDDKMIQSWAPASRSVYHEIFVPTIEITRSKTIIQNLIKYQHYPFIIGETATGKSSIAQMIYKSLENTKYLPFHVNLSFGISTKTLQKVIENNFERRNNKLFPPSNKRAICYVDDLNLPRKDRFGCQTVVEMLRQFLELEGWYSVEQLTYVNIKSMLLFSSIGQRNSSMRSEISSRFLSKFVPINLLSPNDNTKNKIFTTILSFYLSNSQSEDVKKLPESLSAAMIGLYNSVLSCETYRPTPAKCHYIFNLHDITKIFEAISKLKGSNYFTRENYIKVWVHECFRTLSDRFINEEDKLEFRDMLTRQMETSLATSLRDTYMKESRDCMFIDSFTESPSDYTNTNKSTTYDEVTDFEELKKAILSRIETRSAFKQMVFFDQAINYICILRRIISKSSGGHGLLIGLGASGRTSYVKIASELAGYKPVLFTSAKDHSTGEWTEHIKSALRQAGSFNMSQTLILREKDFFTDEVIENVNYILSTGMIPNLYTSTDWDEIKISSGNSQIQLMSTESYLTLFKKNCIENLKIFMTFSPLGDKLKDYCRDYPSIIDCTTIVTFTEWPESALKEVARNFIDVEYLFLDKAIATMANHEKQDIEKDNELTEEEKEKRFTLLLFIADVFSEMHISVFRIIEKMKKENNRHAYFTSTNFINLIKTFNKYLRLKEKTIFSNIEKYRLGIQKIKTGKGKIELMKSELEKRSKEENDKMRENEKLLDDITEKRKFAQEKENDLKYEREKNERNQKYYEKNMEDSKRELLEAEKPMQEAKLLAKERLSRQKLSDFKSLHQVNEEIKNVFYALMAIFNQPQTWEQVKSYIKDVEIERLIEVELLPVTEKGNLPIIQKYSKEFNLDKLRKMNALIPDLALYIQNVEKYFKAKWIAEVKERHLMEASKGVLESLRALDLLEKKLIEIKKEIDELQKDYDEKNANLQRIREETKLIKEKITRASSLTSAFESEETRWQEMLVKNQDLLSNVLGNTILAAGYLTYFGIFPTKYREELRNLWYPILAKKNISFSDKFDFLHFISNQNEIQDWKMTGLPDDNTFIENAVIIKYSILPALIVDPQDQALQWIKGMTYSIDESREDTVIGQGAVGGIHPSSTSVTKKISNYERKVVELTPQIYNYIYYIRNSIDRDTIIINNIGEFLPTELDEFLKMINKDKCSLYLRTKIPNPNFYPEVSSSVNIINFFVNEKGLEEQILSAVVRIEREDTEAQIKMNTKKMFEMQKELDKSEENTLLKLTSANDNYLDDDQLIHDLKLSTEKSLKGAELLKTTSMAFEKINTSREEYRPLARKVSKYFFVLYSMNIINNMYEFSLKSYITLFEKAVKLCNEKGNISSNDSSEDRIKIIEKIHLQKIVQYANQCLFENHRLLFALQLCLATIFANEEEIKRDLDRKGMGKLINMSRGEKNLEIDEMTMNPNQLQMLNKNMIGYNFFNMNEFKMFLTNTYEPVGEKLHKPPWLNDKNSWDFLISLEKIHDLKGIHFSFVHNSSDWHKWYQNKEIENLPVEWESKCEGATNVRKLLFIRALRPDKIAYGLKMFISQHIFDVNLSEIGISLKELITSEVNAETPLMIVHGSGVDPSESLSKLWDELKASEGVEKEKTKNANVDEMVKESKAKMTDLKGKEMKEEKEIKPRFVIATLNQDQWPNTSSTLLEMAKVGGWMFIANTHLTLYGIPLLEKLLDDIKDLHPNFRLIISTNPHPKYPISFLQRCNKITFEAPKGIGANMVRLFEDLQKENLQLETGSKYDKNDAKQSVFSKLVYSLAMFHSMLLERRKYKSYGWTANYDFNNSDFRICFDILRNYMKTYTNANDFPWKAIQELIAINYGSRFTNNKDLELLITYAEHFFNSKLLTDKNYNLSSSSEYLYLIPDDALYEKFKNTTTTDSTTSNKSDHFMRMNFFKEEAKRYKDDAPEVFGLHFNAEISSHIKDNLELLDNIRILCPDLITGAFSSREEVVIKKIHLAKEKMPKLLDNDKKKFLAYDKNTKYDPIHNLLFQEAAKYNSLINLINNDLNAIESAMKGYIILTSTLEVQINSLFDDKVPLGWLATYLSTKSFIKFIEDLAQRVEFFNRWLTNGFVQNYFLGFFTNPIGFIIAIKQKFSLENKVAFNSVTLDFKVVDYDELKANKNGYVISGIFIEGGCWDKKFIGIKDEGVQDLSNTLPPLIMTPIAIEEKHHGSSSMVNIDVMSVKRLFPLYYIPIRGDYLGRNTYIMDITLNLLREKDKDGQDKSNEEIISYWVKKGTCLLLSKSE